MKNHLMSLKHKGNLLTFLMVQTRLNLVLSKV
jgi:hypothetical protein